MIRFVVVAVLLVVSALGCASRDRAAAPLPRGAIVVAHAHATCELARSIGSSSNVEALAVAHDVARVTCACGASDVAWSVADDGELATALRSLRCDAHVPPKIAPAAIGNDDVARIVLAASDDGGARTTATVHASLIVDVAPAPGSAAAVLVGDPIVGGRLADDGALVHVGARTSPTSLAALLDDPKAARVFPGLAVAARALLDGAWEIAVYAAHHERESALLPVVRVGVRAPAQLLDVLLHEAETQWHLTSQRTTIAGKAGACVPDARMLPALSPCAVVDDNALVVAWNQSALEHALASSSSPTLAGIALDRFGAHEPWSRIAVEPHASSLTLRFLARAP